MLAAAPVAAAASVLWSERYTLPPTGPDPLGLPESFDRPSRDYGVH